MKTRVITLALAAMSVTALAQAPAPSIAVITQSNLKTDLFLSLIHI